VTGAGQAHIHRKTQKIRAVTNGGEKNKKQKNKNKNNNNKIKEKRNTITKAASRLYGRCCCKYEVWKVYFTHAIPVLSHSHQMPLFIFTPLCTPVGDARENEGTEADADADADAGVGVDVDVDVVPAFVVVVVVVVVVAVENTGVRFNVDTYLLIRRATFTTCRFCF
jgi:hypothetical protein